MVDFMSCILLVTNIYLIVGKNLIMLRYVTWRNTERALRSKAS